MAKVDTLWTCVGITKLRSRSGKDVVKVRFGVDLLRRVKSVQGFIKNTEGQPQDTRVDFISLPEPMNKMAALQYARQAPEFQSAEDQAIIDDALMNREPKPVKTAKTVKKVKATKNEAVSLSSIRARAKKASVSDVLAAVDMTAVKE